MVLVSLCPLAALACWTTLAALSKGNQLRPEYLNAAFDLYVQLQSKVYETTSYDYFQNMKTYNRAPNGYTIINDVTTRPMVQGSESALSACEVYGRHPAVSTFCNRFRYVVAEPGRFPGDGRTPGRHHPVGVWRLWRYPTNRGTRPASPPA